MYPIPHCVVIKKNTRLIYAKNPASLLKNPGETLSEFPVQWDMILQQAQQYMFQ